MTIDAQEKLIQDKRTRYTFYSGTRRDFTSTGLFSVVTRILELNRSILSVAPRIVVAVATVQFSVARAALGGRVIPSFTIARHTSIRSCLRMLKQQIRFRFTVLSKQQ
jgi:hypothetical protein